MTFEKFCKEHKIQTKKDELGDLYAPGKLGHLFDFDENVVGAMFIPDEPMKGWKHRKDELTAVGAEVIQDGDMEGTVTFEMKNKKAMRTAMKLLGIRVRRTVSPEKAERLRQQLVKARTTKRAS